MLILDEPTNHLDIDSKEMLEQALKHFEGTIIFVSHDRYFINQLANKVFDLNHEGGQIYLGDYQYYIEKTEETAALKAQEELKNSSSKPITIMTLLFLLQHIQVKKQQKSHQRKIERQIEQCETKIEEFETHISYIETQLTQPEVFNDPMKAAELAEEKIIPNKN